jgi:hypothetical protein
VNEKDLVTFWKKADSNSQAKHQPVKVYSDVWYQKVRPSGSVNSEKKIVDNNLVKVMNKQIQIEKDLRNI